MNRFNVEWDDPAQLTGEELVAEHFLKAYDDRGLAVARLGDTYLVTDGYMMLVLPSTHSLFDSRSRFPEMPAEGESRGYGAMAGKERNKMLTVWREQIPLATRPIEVTHWCLDTNHYWLRRVFRFAGGSQEQVHLQRMLTNLLGKTFEELQDYQVFGTDDSSPVLFRKDNLPVALVMPMNQKVLPLSDRQQEIPA